MAGTGPAPNPNARRRNARVGPVRLPSGGRKGKMPPWPLPENPKLTASIRIESSVVEDLELQELERKLNASERRRLNSARDRLAVAEETQATVREQETSFWADLWKTPQAVEWERLGWTREVAQYVRWKVLAECGDLDAGKEARQYADRLGLNPKAMRSLMWTIDHDEVGEQRQTRTAAKKAPPKRRLRAVDSAAGS